MAAGRCGRSDPRRRLNSLVLRLAPPTLGLTLAACAGLFLYIGASDLLPESYHEHPTAGTTAMTILGAATMFIAIRLVSD